MRSYLAGMHNPLIHTGAVTIGWIKLFGSLPSLKEFLCIAFHDIGYLGQKTIDGADNDHPKFGAKMCGILLGEECYYTCIAHSREYAKKLGLPLSKLGYADKYSVLVYPEWLFSRLIVLGGERDEYYRTTKTKKWGYPIQVKLIKRSYRKWIDENVL